MSPEYVRGPPTSTPGAVQVEDKDFFVAVMLIGSVAFVLSLLYLLHWHDPDIRSASWSVVSTSICMFTGVLIGISWSGCFNSLVIGPPAVAGPVKTIVCDLWACLGWYVALQVVLAAVSGVGCCRRARGAKRDRVQTVLNLKCFAVLLGVTTGASNLNLWGLVQQQVPHTVPHLLGICLVCLACLSALFKVGDIVREFVSNSDDGRTDHYEQMWDRFAEQTEDTTISMTMAHLVTQATRFHISGVLPLPAGQVPPGSSPTMRHAAELFFAGAAYAILAGALGPPSCGQQWPIARRIHVWCKRTAGNTTAFCWLYAITWVIQGALHVPGPPGSMLLALAVTFVGFSLIFVMDFISDRACTSSAIDSEARSLVGPLSLLIGMGWKQAFVSAIATITARDDFLPPATQTLLMAIVLAIVVVPAWRLYILPVVMEEEVQKQERSRAVTAASVAGRAVNALAGSKSAPLLAVSAPSTPGAPTQEAQEPRYAELVQRNRDLEESIRNIRGELGELKNLAALMR